MSKELTKPERLIAFLSGELTPEEENEFRQELETDEEISAVKDRLRVLHKRTERAMAFEANRETERKRLSKLSPADQLNDALVKLGKKKKTPPRLRMVYRLSAAAASIAVLIFAWFTIQAPQVDDLVADNFVAYRPESTMGGSNSEAFSTINERYISTLSKPYDTKISLQFRDICDTLARLEASPQISLLRAHASFSCGDYSESAALFSEIANGDSSGKYTAKWNSIIAYLAAGNNLLVVERKLKEVISNPDNPYSDKAVELLKNLKKVED